MSHLPLLVLLIASFAAFAQSGNRITEQSAAPPSRWQQDQDTLDQALRSRVLVASDPRDQWIAGELETVDPWAQVAAFAQARTRMPNEKLYVASLGMACVQPLQPLPPDCDATDRLADWAIRDSDNGVPVLLLADRARRRNNPASMLAFLEEAAMRPRFEDYRDRGSLFIWEALRALPGNTDPAARAELAATYAARNSYAVQQIENICRESQRLADPVRNACSAAGAAAAQRATSWPLRAAGARLAARTTTSAQAQTQLADVQRRAYDCTQAATQASQSLESEDASTRTRAVAQWEARIAKQAQVGEVAACEVKS